MPRAIVFVLVAATAGAAAPPTGPELVARARDQLGTPYTWGGVGEGGFDCSGFVTKVYAEHGYVLPRTSRELYLVGDPVPAEALAPGDVVFFVSAPGASRINHVGIYAGEGEFLHASSGKGEVTYDRLSSRYYQQRFFGARRILALPPGMYSRADGSARIGDGEGSLDALVHDALAAESQGSLFAEHAPGERPPQLAAGLPRGELTRVGPVTLLPESTALGVRFGAGRLGGTAHLLMAPQWSYFDHATAFALVLAVPLAWPLTDTSTQERAWDDVRDYGKVLRELRYGQKESELFFELGHTGSGTLGHGALMRLLTPNVASRSVPDFAVTADALALSFDVAWGGVAAQSFVADVLAPEVGGVRVAWRPGARAATGEVAGAAVGFSYAVDARAPYQPAASGEYDRRAVHGVGLDAELMLAHARAYDFTAYADVSALLQQGSRGVGGTAGAVSSARFAGRRHVVRLRLEGRLSSPAFLPSYFDVTYGVDRTQAPGDDPAAPPLTKLALLESLATASPRWSAYGELTYQMQRRARVGLAYEDSWFLGDDAGAFYGGRHLLFYLELRELYLPRSSRRFSFAFAYHRRNFERLVPFAAPERRNEFFFAAIGLELSRYVTMGGSLRRALDLDRGDPSLDGALDLTVRYEL